MTCIARNVALSDWKSGESTQVSSGHLLCVCSEALLQSLVSPNTNGNHASSHLSTRYPAEGPNKAILSTSVFQWVWSCSGHLRWTRHAVSIILNPGISHSQASIPIPSNWSALCDWDNWACRTLKCFVVFSPNGMHHTLHHGMQCIGNVIFHHSIILSIFRCTGKQPHHLIAPIQMWMESWCCCDLKLELKSNIHCNQPADINVVLFPLDISNLAKPFHEWDSRPLLTCLPLDHKVLHDRWWIFHWSYGLWIHVFRFFCVSCAFAMSNKLTSSK